MYKKLITACMAIAAFAAFVVPSTASATNDPTLVEGASHTPLAVGAQIVGTNIGETTFTNTTGGGLVHCSKALMTGEVVKNSGGTVEGTIETADFWGTGPEHSHNKTPECTGTGNAWITVVGKLCVRSTPAMATHEFQIEQATGTCTGLQGDVKFIIGSTFAGECEYTSTGPVKGDLVATTGDEVKVRHTQEGSGSTKIRGSFLCPSSGQLKMTFTLETHNGTAVNVIDRP